MFVCVAPTHLCGTTTPTKNSRDQLYQIDVWTFNINIQSFPKAERRKLSIWPHSLFFTSLSLSLFLNSCENKKNRPLNRWTPEQTSENQGSKQTWSLKGIYLSIYLPSGHKLSLSGSDFFVLIFRIFNTVFLFLAGAESLFFFLVDKFNGAMSLLSLSFYIIYISPLFSLCFLLQTEFTNWLNWWVPGSSLWLVPI